MKTKKKANLLGVLEIPAKRKAISYIRFSTSLQGEKGRDSTRRQTEALDEALARWNLELDATFKDEGKSGYHQRHLAKGGAMYRLRQMALDGQLVGKCIVLEDWDTGMSPENSFIIIYESAGSCNGRDMLNQASRYVYDSLDSMNKFAPKIKLNSKSRLADTIARFNKNVSKLASIEVNGVSLTADEIEALKIPIPASESYTASASDKSGKVKSLSLEVTR